MGIPTLGCPAGFPAVEDDNHDAPWISHLVDFPLRHIPLGRGHSTRGEFNSETVHLPSSISFQEQSFPLPPAPPAQTPAPQTPDARPRKAKHHGTHTNEAKKTGGLVSGAPTPEGHCPVAASRTG